MAGDLTTIVELQHGMTFQARTGTGHELTMDASPAVGGSNSAARPMEMLLAGLGGCTGMDVISILSKMRQEVTSYQVHVSGDQAREHPRVFTRIDVEHVVHGRGLNVDMVKRAIELSATRYCPAQAMLGAVAQIQERYRVIDEITGAEHAGTLEIA
jgi:putative redox protein